MYSCSSCKSLGKNRSVTVIDGRIVGRKHPEDDHHVDCRPISSALVEVVDMDGLSPPDAFRSENYRKETKRSLYGYHLSEETKRSLYGYHLGHPPKNQVFVGISSCRRSLSCILLHPWIIVSASERSVPDAQNIPDNFRITLRGKELPEGDVHNKIAISAVHEPSCRQQQ